MFRRVAIPALALTAAALLAASPRPAAAGSRTSSLAVSATVLGVCTIAPATLAFGAYDPAASTDLDALPADITVRCTNGTTYSINLGTGANASGATRRMVGGAVGSTDHLTYELYSDSGHTTIWTTGASSSASTAGAGLNQYTHQVWGRIPAGQNVSTGSYADSVVMTVNF